MSVTMAKISYTRVGDYLLPDIKLQDLPPKWAEGCSNLMGRYGQMRRSFLREHRSIHYNTLLLSEQLFPHLREVDEAANRRLGSLISDILLFNPPPDKAADNLAWAAHMTEIKRIAEKMMLDELVYT